MGYRPTEVKDLKILKAPEEGGTEKDYDDLLEAIERHVNIAWLFGPDMAHILKEGELPEIEEPNDLSAEEKGQEWRKLLWEKRVHEYGNRMATLDANVKALYSLILNNVSKVTRSQVASITGFVQADKDKDPFWLMDTLSEIMSKFKKIKHPVLALDDQMERIMNLRQKATTSNEDFLKQLNREIKIYEKYGGKFLWSVEQKKKLKEFDENSDADWSDDEKIVG